MAKKTEEKVSTSFIIDEIKKLNWNAINKKSEISFKIAIVGNKDEFIEFARNLMKDNSI